MNTQIQNINGDFIDEGFFLAMPVGFPGMSMPIERSFSQLKHLHLAKDGRTVCALTRGPEPRVIQFVPKSTYGFAVDLGSEPDVVEGITMVSRMNSSSLQLLVASKMENGSRLSFRIVASLATGIQEWHTMKQNFLLSLDFPNDTILDLHVSENGKRVTVLFENKLALIDWAPRGLELCEEIELKQHPCAFITASEVAPTFIDTAGQVYRVVDARIEPCATIPGIAQAICFKNCPGGVLWADAQSGIHEWTFATNEVRTYSSLPLQPIYSLLKHPDGRIFIVAGSDIAHFYVIEPGQETARDLGVPVSTLSTRRYGLQFADLILGRDGEIYAAEDDMGGHLWIYFPALFVRDSPY